MSENKKHICYLANASSIHVAKLVNYFNKNGYRTSVISFSPGKIEGAEVFTIDLKILSKSKLKYIIGLPFIKKILTRLKPDILHAVYLSGYGLMGALTKFHPLIVSALGSDVLITPEKSFIQKFLTIYTIKKADLIHSQAFHMTDKLISLGAQREKIITFSYGVDLEKFKQKKEINLQNGKPKIILSTRNFEPVYNLELLIRSIPKVLKKMPGVKFWLVGSGSEEKKLKEIVSELRINGAVSFLGRLSNDEIINLLGGADIYISTSLSDGASISLLESMAAGVFPIVTDIPANQEWVKDNINGFLCPTNNPDKLAEKIMEILVNNNLKQKAIEINYSLVREKGSFSQGMKLIERHYLKLLNNR